MSQVLAIHCWVGPLHPCCNINEENGGHGLNVFANQILCHRGAPCPTHIRDTGILESSLPQLDERCRPLHLDHSNLSLESATVTNTDAVSYFRCVLRSSQKTFPPRGQRPAGWREAQQALGNLENSRLSTLVKTRAKILALAFVMLPILITLFLACFYARSIPKSETSNFSAEM
jgi:hypothetical protein